MLVCYTTLALCGARRILDIALHFCMRKASVILAALPLSCPQRPGFERASLSSGEDGRD